MAIKDFKTREITDPNKKDKLTGIIGEEGTIIFEGEGCPPYKLKVYSIEVDQVAWFDRSEDIFAWRTSDGRPLDISLQRELDDFLEKRRLEEKEMRLRKIIQKIIKLAEEQEEE